MKPIKPKIEYFIFGFLAFFHFFIYLTGNGDEVAGRIPQWVSLPVEGAFLLFSFYYCLCYKHICQKLSRYLLFVILLGLVMGFLHQGPKANMTIMMDLLICLMLLNSVFLIDIKEELIIKFVVVISVISLLICGYELAHFDVSSLATLIAARGELWKQPVFFAATMLWMSSFMMIYSVVFNKYYWVSISVWAMAFVVNAIATKRTFIIETGLIIVCISYFYWKTKELKKLKYVGLAILFGAGLLFFAGDKIGINLQELFTIQQARMESDGYNVDNIRVLESANYLKRASIIDLFLGRGLAVPHFGHPDDPTLTTLHIGITNLLFKFGLFLVVLYIGLLFKTIRKAVHLKTYYLKDKWQVVCILTALSQAPIMLFVGNYWALGVEITFFWYCLFRANVTKNVVE